ncbi:DNA-binding protein [Streptomyces sp. NPDC006334]|uniref:DNA-binding protein n=1 Tax=Streptomyces sp. NPDC006334 TaxID=3156754 RepID=UPI0033A9A142
MTQEPSNESATLTVGELLALPATIDVATAGRAFGIGRTTSYQLARADQFPCKVVRAGRAFRVVTADLHRVLGVQRTDEQAPAA